MSFIRNIFYIFIFKTLNYAEHKHSHSQYVIGTIKLPARRCRKEKHVNYCLTLITKYIMKIFMFLSNKLIKEIHKM